MRVGELEIGGKTAVAADLLLTWARQEGQRIAIVARDVHQARCIVGEVLAHSERGFIPVYRPSRRSLEWPNGSRALLLSMDEPSEMDGVSVDRAWLERDIRPEHPIYVVD